MGLLLGGGISFQSPLYGWSADSIKEMDVVLVTGDLVTASNTNQYSDLFSALKGGANRFGIVTRYELYPVQTGTEDNKAWFGGSITVNSPRSRFHFISFNIATNSILDRLQSPSAKHPRNIFERSRTRRLVRGLAFQNIP